MGIVCNLKPGSKNVSLIFLLFCVLALSGCLGKPFSLHVNQINENDPQQRAVITLSDPQIFQRETLINDRLREAELIKKLLKESSVIEGETDFRKKFTSQIVRDLETYKTISAGLNAHYDEKSKQVSSREEELARLEHQIALTNKRFELEDLLELRNVDSRIIQSNKTDDTGGDDAGGDDTGEDDTGEDDTGEDDTGEDDTGEDDTGGDDTGGDDTGGDGTNGNKLNENVLTSFNETFDRNQQILNQLKVSQNQNANSSVDSTPQEQFRDLQAYRSELRQELAALNLDDLHDHDGNSIYRMQFRATVMPGKHKDKFGVSQFTVIPPELSIEEITDIYYAWLNHITYRMNYMAKFEESRILQQYAALESGRLLGIYAIDVYKALQGPSDEFSNRRNSGDNTSCVDYARGSGFTQRTSLSVGCILIAYPYEYKFSTSKNEVQSRTYDFIKEMNSFKGINISKMTKEDHQLLKYMLSSIRQLLSNAELNPIFESQLSGLALELRDIVEKARHFNNFYQTPLRDIPPQDFIKIVSSTPTSRDKLVATGKARIYSANPVEYSQRMSTTSRSANSLELALSLSAAEQLQGVDADLGVSYLRTAAGNIEAMERVPLVVGFADRRQKCTDKACTSKSKNSELSSAGWVFGPSVRVNPKEETLNLVQNVSAYDVSADLSIPGWWPSVTLEKESAWIGNWHNRGTAIDLANESSYSKQIFDVDLPLNRIDLDGLTNLIAKKTTGSFAELLKVHNIEPSRISACMNEVTLLIKGVNIWRSTEVYLGGISSKQIVVLPDMEGVAAKFDLSELFTSKNLNQKLGPVNHKISLTIWTRNGSDKEFVILDGLREKVGGAITCSSQNSLSVPLDDNKLKFTEVIPKKISTCGNDIEILTNLNFQTINPTFYLNGSKGSIIDENSVKTIFNLKFDKKIIEKVIPNYQVELSVVDGYDIASIPIKTKNCVKNQSLPNISLKLKDKLVVSSSNSNSDITFDVRLEHLSGKFAQRKIRLGLRVENLSDRDWYESGNMPIASVEDIKTLSAKFTVKKSESDIHTSLTSGRVLNFALLIYKKGSDSEVGKIIKLQEGAIFYFNGDEKIKTSPNSSDEFPDNSLKVVMPMNFVRAYSNMDNAIVSAKFDDTDLKELKDVKLKIAPNVLNDSFVLSFADAASKSIYDSFRASAKAKKHDVRIKFNLINPGNNKLPEMKSYIIKKTK